MAAACAIPDAAASFIFLILLQLLTLNQARLWSGKSAGALASVCSHVLSRSHSLTRSCFCTSCSVPDSAYLLIEPLAFASALLLLTVVLWRSLLYCSHIACCTSHLHFAHSSVAFEFGVRTSLLHCVLQVMFAFRVCMSRSCLSCVYSHALALGCTCELLSLRFASVSHLRCAFARCTCTTHLAHRICNEHSHVALAICLCMLHA